MTRLLLVTGDLPPGFVGGVASWVHDLALAATAAGHRVTVLGRAGRDRSTERSWDAAQPYTVRRAWGRSWNRWRAWWIDLAGRALLADCDAVVFATWPLAVRLAPRAARAGLPVGIAFHGSDLTRLAAPPPALTTACRSARALLPVSRFLAGELQRLGQGESGVLKTPLPMPLPPPPPHAGDFDRRGLLCVARLTPLKGVDRAIRLARQLEVPLTVIGDGPEERALRALAGPETRFLGRLDRVATLSAYERHRACCLLSRTDSDGSGAEGFGLTLVEAQARGCLALGCRTGGIPEATGPGLLLDDPDAPDLDRVRRFLTDARQPERARTWATTHHSGPLAVAALMEALA